MRRLTPGEWNRRLLPHYFGKFAPADFHAHLDADLTGLHTRRATKRSYIAPRGGAKSTWCTLAYPLRAALERWEPYTAILSDSSEQANQLLGHIKSELTENDTLQLLYPESAGEGPEWRDNHIRLKNGSVIAAFGSGKKIRGRRNRSERPSLIIFDDVQSNQDARSPVLREHAWQWATREVMNAGDERTNFLAVGSALHPEAVAVRLGALPGWVGHTFPAVHSWPDRLDLWDRYVQIACDSAAPNKLELAQEYFEVNRREMMAGALTYWPARWSLADLMLKRSEIGAPAFQSEYQGVPSVAEGAEFPAEWFARPETWFDAWPERFDLKVIALDPSKGTDGKGDDFQAHVMLGVVNENGRYVIYVDADADRLGVVQMCSRTVELYRRFSAEGERAVDSVVCEENGTLGLLQPALDAAAAKAHCLVPYILRSNMDKKEFRIRYHVGPPLSRYQLRFRRTPGGRMLVGQLQEFPKGTHDDLPDALASGLKRVAELLQGGGR